MGVVVEGCVGWVGERTEVLCYDGVGYYGDHERVEGGAEDGVLLTR